MTVLDAVEPMGIYETLYAFQEACGRAMGDVERTRGARASR